MIREVSFILLDLYVMRNRVTFNILRTSLNSLMLIFSNLDHFLQEDDFKKWLRQRLDAAEIVTAWKKRCGLKKKCFWRKKRISVESQSRLLGSQSTAKKRESLEYLSHWLGWIWNWQSSAKKRGSLESQSHRLGSIWNWKSSAKDTSKHYSKR